MPLELIELLRPVQADLRAVEEEIARLIDTPVPIIREVTLHTLGAGGKRLRPTLTLLSAKAVGNVTPQVITLASLVELTHTATLIHDDVVDHAEMRRGRRAANVLWGNEATVLVGDYIYSQVVFILSHDEFKPFMYTLARATNRMCAGELLEIELRRKLTTTEAEYKQLIQYKTAELISAACQLGALGARGKAAEVRALGDYGLHTGMAFQIADDLLDVVSDRQKIGKPVGHDAREGKITLPYIRTLAVAEPADRMRLEQLLGSEDWDNAAMEEVTAIVRRYDGIAYSQQVAREYVHAAQRALAPLRPSPIKDILHAVAEFVVVRET
ncbi:MAG: polyprenyl synthetase family protein [Abditibacteriales bacterium]|nr:polyprenyl synthetase family protein [Abditibacteriales bacterium]MDW8366111.1 polyprenyl synthetase family protein [Abditibacteriales bacterium]